MSISTDLAEERFKLAQEQLQRLRATLSAAVVGQERLLDELIAALFAGGHVLLEGLPGLGKTHLAKGMARALGLELNRVQCTPDLMPSDVTGSEVLVPATELEKGFSFLPGPLFGHMVLVDEINRATPRTQAAMLEAMQEQQVTVLGRSHPLPLPFWVLATQNPIELEGTYPLPEAQLDRFLFKLRIELPDRNSLLAMLEVSLDEEPVTSMEPVLDLPEVVAIMATAKEVMIAKTLKEAAVDLVLSTQPRGPGSSAVAQQYFRYGASPRGLQALLRAARVSALMAGRTHVADVDLAAVALPALRHRVLLNIDSEVHGVEVDTVLEEHIAQWLQQR